METSQAASPDGLTTSGTSPALQNGRAASLDELAYLLAVARGEEPADLVLEGAQLLNVFTLETYPAQVAIVGERIAGIGEGYEGREVHHLKGYLLPGFLDAHLHLESSLLRPYAFAQAVIPRGTTTVVADPHEMANVAGLEGIRYLIEASRGLPLSVFWMLPSCVPASPLSQGGAALTASTLQELRELPEVLGLGEYMNFLGALQGEAESLEKLMAFEGMPIDGHAPGLSGPSLQAYAAAGPGSDHESTTAQEAWEKLRAGMWIFLREGSVARNLRALLPIVQPATWDRLAFCTDDRHPIDLLEEGHIDALIRMAIRKGVPPPVAIRMATLNPAQAFGLRDRGALAPGRTADLVLSPSLERPEAVRVYAKGQLVAEEGAPIGYWVEPQAPEGPLRSRPRIPRVDLRIPGQAGQLRVIGVIPGELLTEARLYPPFLKAGEARADRSRDLLKLAVINCYGADRYGVGFVQGFGLQQGALASSIAHDSHNFIVVGADDTSMLTALAALTELGGGLVAAQGDQILGQLPLPLGGLLSDLDLPQTAGILRSLQEIARQLGCQLNDPWMSLSFLSLEVIPELKLTDRGLVGRNLQLLSLWV